MIKIKINNIFNLTITNLIKIIHIINLFFFSDSSNWLNIFWNESNAFNINRAKISSINPTRYVSEASWRAKKPDKLNLESKFGLLSHFFD